MNNKKKETKVLCPRCGTEFAIAEKEYTTLATVVGKNSGLSVVYPAVAKQDVSTNSPKLPKTAQDRIEALRNAGVDVSCLFAMREQMAASVSHPTKTENSSYWMTTTHFSVTSSNKARFPTAVFSVAG
ncbi:hypothetical protein SFC43_13550 [Bacteroides sp. CR5/BHMF/2]|nr:hypothetical protein [Bacteroides sp. CR5/BHMF/2]